MTQQLQTPRTPLDAVDKTVVRDVVRRMGIDAPADSVVEELAHVGIDASPQQIDRVKADVAAGAASQGKPSLEPASEWHRHEHVSESANVQAQKLVEQAGSPELAKQAIDAVTERPLASPPVGAAAAADRQSVFAKQLGFESYLELFEASTPAPSADGKSWCVTSDRQGEWVVWNDQDLMVHRRFSSREEAVASVAAFAALDPIVPQT